MLFNRTLHGNMIPRARALHHGSRPPLRIGERGREERRINILEIRAFGSFGRLYLGGEEEDIDVASKAAEAAINSLTGRAMKGSGGA
jgi:hypothetical protein